MAYNNRSERPDSPMKRRGGRRRKKVCVFCGKENNEIDYKDVAKLRKYVSERGKILPRRITGNCAKHQRALTVAVKRARHLAMMAISSRTNLEAVYRHPGRMAVFLSRACLKNHFRNLHAPLCGIFHPNSVCRSPLRRPHSGQNLPQIVTHIIAESLFQTRSNLLWKILRNLLYYLAKAYFACHYVKGT